MGLLIDNQPPTKWKLNHRLFPFSRTDSLTLEESFLGLLATGGTGSGKSTGLVNHALRAFCRKGFGGLILCAKLDAALEYRRIIQEEGRAPIVFGTDSHHVWNFLDYEAKRYDSGKAIIENLVVILSSASELVSRKYGDRSGDKFWEDTRDQILRNCLWVAITATGGIDLRDVLKMIQQLPQSSADLEEPERLYCLKLLQLAEQKAGPERAAELGLAKDYFHQQIPGLSDRTRSSIVLTLSVLLDAFLRYPLADLFTGESTVTPDDIVKNGEIVIVDVPIKEYELIAKVAGVLWKTSVQRAVERNPALEQMPADRVRPTFILADEFQFWANSHDALFQATARSSRGITCYATQSIKAIESELGGDPTSLAKVQWLLGNLQNRFYFQNTCIETNRFAAEAIGKIWLALPSGSSSATENMGRGANRHSSDSQSSSESWSQQLVYDVEPREFTGLKRGGKKYRFNVEAIVTSAGKKFKQNGKRWLRINFKQFTERPGWLRLVERKPHAYIAENERSLSDWLPTKRR